MVPTCKNAAETPLIFEDVIGAYLSVRPQLEKAIGRDTYSYKRLHPHFSGRPISDVRRADVRAYITHRLSDGVKLSTVRRELRLFCAAINFVRDEYEIDIHNPVARLSLECGEPRVRWITRDEASRLISAAEGAVRPHLACFIRLALNTGCRRNELLMLEWSRVDESRRAVLLEARHTKGRKRRTVPLNDEAITALSRLRQWQEDVGLSSDYVFGWERGRHITSFKTAWKSVLARAEITDFRIHDMRHTFASWLVMQGVSLYVVKELLGHASITQTEIYAHLAPDQGHEAVQRLLPL